MSLNTGALTQLNNALPDPSLLASQLIIERKPGSHTGTLLPASTVAFPSHLGSKLTSKALPPPGPGSLTASNLHIQFAFQDFFHRAPTNRIPKSSRGESLDVFHPCGGRRPMRGGLHPWFTPVLHGLNPYLLKGRMEERENSPIILPSQKLKSQTTGKSFSDPAFQMGLSPDSFKFFPPCLHLNSLQASWICSPLLFNSSGHQTPPDSKSPTSFRGLTSFALNRFVLLRVSTIFPPLILAVHYPSSVLPFSLCFLPEYQGFPKLLIWAPKTLSPLWAILSILMDLATCSVKNTQAPCSSQFSLSKSRLLLLMNYRTLPANFKIIELQVVGEGLEIS